MSEVVRQHPAFKYMRKQFLPHIWCPGCGNGLILAAIIRAIDELGIDIDETSFVTGIGCWGLTGNYINADWLHTTHGRALPMATGLKLMNPKLKVFALTGDGDLAAIGGNHFIHAARRNVDLITICSNNMIFGRTGGQVAPTTPEGKYASTSPYGNIERPFDLCRLAEAAGATHVERWTVMHPVPLTKAIKKAIEHKGFSFIEVLSPCPVQYGRKNKFRNPSVLYNWVKEQSVSIKKAQDMSEQELEGKFIIGEFVKKENIPDLSAQLLKLQESFENKS
ncbi:2-oxoacid:ferredoxin oxidoreductase subunit beta [Desulfofundulus salinus]|jgi:2-oxoglutarate ferredoxin oxidoreductase subunit beta|uniref:2-oxoacid:ferredoxin oxidoreductase subunit beta n=1 Tax=Desulfofundulus salinus TaxID=2419843 RepID=A0A494WX22_9FIRM|nr:2-oxoacid:ferredoxin oxidoreductase subunit beta [Desulfofundulus salinum]RKO67523.1 2-oxoacid:ferredoxin oxidoreductase subunit beta [Desulfofundulus salinum]